MKLHKQLIIPLTLSSALAMNSAWTGNEKKDEGHEKTQSENIIEKGKANAEEVWDATKEVTHQAWQDTKKSTKHFWSDTQEMSKKTWNSTEEAFSEGVMAGRLETALMLNDQLNPFRIDFTIEKQNVVLEGTVGSEAIKELAEEVTEGVEGVAVVENNITVDPDLAQELSVNTPKREFAQYVKDVTTTAWVKTALLADNSINGLDINVDTYRGKVYLKGQVENTKQRQLAEEIAGDREGIKVINELVVDS